MSLCRQYLVRTIGKMKAFLQHLLTAYPNGFFARGQERLQYAAVSAKNIVDLAEIAVVCGFQLVVKGVSAKIVAEFFVGPAL